jgi:hypothetical protein
MFISILIFFNFCWIGDKYFNLANTYERPKWIWAIFGVISSFIAFKVLIRMLFVLTLGVFDIWIDKAELIVLLVVTVFQFIALKYLKNRWESEIYEHDNDTIEDIGTK